jgi:hypothetical protein
MAYWLPWLMEVARGLYERAITAQSHDCQMDFGLMADAAAMPDVAALAAGLREAFDELAALPVPLATPATRASARLARRPDG